VARLGLVAAALEEGGDADVESMQSGYTDGSFHSALGEEPREAHHHTPHLAWGRAHCAGMFTVALVCCASLGRGGV
jgi:hypothetical protein